MKVHVHNWDERQTFRYGNPSWIKLYVDATEHKKTKALSNHDLGLLVRLWLLAAKYGNGFDIESYIVVTASVRSAIERFRILNLLNIEGEFSETETEETEVDLRSTISSIVEFLNKKTGRNYGKNSKLITKLVKARMSDGYTEQHFRMVIIDRCDMWMGDPKMEEYLRPSTLFGKENFTKYIEDIQAKGGIEDRPSIFSRNGGE